MIPTKNRFLSLLAAYLVTAPLVHGKLYEDFAQVPAGIQFDYVIVGGAVFSPQRWMGCSSNIRLFQVEMLATWSPIDFLRMRT